MRPDVNTKTRRVPKGNDFSPHCLYGEARLVCALNLRGMAEGATGTLDADSCESSEILPASWKTSSRVAEEAPAFARGHDFVRLLGAALAANRGRPAHHRFHATAYLCRIRDFR